MLEYLNFCLLCILFTSIFYLCIGMKKYILLLKRAEKIFSGYDVRQASDSKRLKLLECVLTGNSKLYLGKVYTKDRLKNLSEKKWISSLVIMKLSYHVRW